MELQRLIARARGEEPADLVVTGARVVNVFSGEIHEADVAIADGIFLGFGDYEARERLDAGGRFMCPGLVEGHIHVESTLLAPVEFARAVAARGTAAVVCDPHEIANVYGRDGVEYMLRSSESLPVAMYFMVPSCVPATTMETAGAVLTADDIAWLFQKFPDRVLGLAEMMNYPGVLFRDSEVLRKLETAKGRVLDGHAPLLTGRDLNAYIAAGPGSDHECTKLEEAREKLSKGMHIFMREGSNEHNVRELAPLLNPYNAANLSLVSDDRSPLDLAYKGHLDYSIRLAMLCGISPLHAIQAATINTARYFGLKRHGAIAPGRRADFMLLDALESFSIAGVYLGGKPVESLDFKGGNAAVPGGSIHVAPFGPDIFHIPARLGSLRVIDIFPGQIVTGKAVLSPTIHGDRVEADAARDMAKLAVIERHQASGRAGLGFVRGLKLPRGAVAGTVAHDSHNLIVAGMNDADMYLAAREVIDMCGGFVVVCEGKVQARLPLPVAGLMSLAPLETVSEELVQLQRAYGLMGGGLEDPFTILQFLALPVIPRLKLTDKGLVDVESFSIVDLWEV